MLKRCGLGLLALTLNSACTDKSATDTPLVPSSGTAPTPVGPGADVLPPGPASMPSTVQGAQGGAAAAPEPSTPAPQAAAGKGAVSPPVVSPPVVSPPVVVGTPPAETPVAAGGALSTAGAGAIGGAGGAAPVGAGGEVGMAGASAAGQSSAGGQPAGGGASPAPAPQLPTGTISITDVAPGWASEAGGITGGGTDLASATTVTSQAEFDAAIGGSGIILVEPGTYRFDPPVEPNSNTSIIGTAPGVVISGGIELREKSNLIFRNFEIKGDPCDPADCNPRRDPCRPIDECRDGDDGFLVADGTHHVWVDHVAISDGQDGNLDTVRGADYVTASWCHFSYSTMDHPHAFSNLIAGSDGESESEGKLRITFANNWWGVGVRERMPRGRFGKVHVFNNYYNTIRTDGYVMGPGHKIQMIVENNFFEEDPGKAAFTTSFEDETTAYRATGNEGTASAPLNKEKGSVFTVPYAYDLMPAANVKAVVTAADCGAGATCVLER